MGCNIFVDKYCLREIQCSKPAARPAASCLDFRNASLLQLSSLVHPIIGIVRSGFYSNNFLLNLSEKNISPRYFTFCRAITVCLSSELSSAKRICNDDWAFLLFTHYSLRMSIFKPVCFRNTVPFWKSSVLRCFCNACDNRNLSAASRPPFNVYKSIKAE